MRKDVLGFALVMLGCSAGFVACGDSSTSEFGSSGGPDSGANGDGSGGCTQFGGCEENDGSGPTPTCIKLQCAQQACTPTTKTTLTGKVYDPAGKVPLYNVVVYVPNGDPAPITTGLGAQCDRCDGKVSGDPIASTLTDASGSFTLTNIPADVDFPLVMQVGKWRRKVTIPKVAPCTTAIADAGITRLPRNRAEGDIPKIALSTGGADPLECLFRKIGLDDSEFAASGEPRVHLYEGGGIASADPPQIATKSFKAGGDFLKSETLMADLAKLKTYDIVVLSCEGDENPASKPVASRQALYDYATVGGRVFTSHFHHYWFSNSPVAEVKGLASWTNDYTCLGPSCTFTPEPASNVTVNATVNDGFPKGVAMKQWLKNTNALLGPGETLPIQEARHNVDSVTTNALSWMTMKNPAAADKLAHEYITFNTPVGAADDQVCGRVVYSDLHVGAGDSTNKPFPEGCTTPDLTPQQKALEFMLFDLSSCIQKDDKPVPVPK